VKRLETIGRFLDAFLANDSAAATALVTEDFRLVAVPMGPGVLQGREQLRHVLDNPTLGFPRAPEQCEHRIIRSVEQGDIIMHERLDRFRFNGEWYELPIASTFIFQDERIVEETDYFDSASYLKIRSASESVSP
jgi:limonene-1,2-epoxide hydrolase